ncbi:MAG: GEVED domain-containing protein [Bacteroidota bacterium]
MKKQLLSLMVFVFSLFCCSVSYSQIYRPFNLSQSLLYGSNKYDPDIKEIENITVSGTSPVHVVLPVLFNGLSEVEVTLTYQSIYADGFKVVSNLSNGAALNVDVSDFYMGTIDGNAESVVVLGIDKDQACSVYINNGTEACVMKQDANVSGLYELYVETSSNNPFNLTDEVPISNPASAPATTGEINSMPPTKCIGAYLEVAHDYYLYFDQSIKSVTNIMTAGFASNVLIYAREGVPVKLTELYIWETPDPYTDSTIFLMLEHFTTARPNFPGHISQLMKKTNVTALVGGVAHMGPGYCTVKMHSINNVFDSAPDYPSYSGFITTMAHEFGHTLGCPHTQSCSWPGGPIDNCAPSEIGCPNGPPNVPGSIMSYCSGYTLTNGFLRLPGNRIRENFLAFDPACLFDGDSLPLNQCPPPTNLTVSLPSYNAITVTWNSSGAASYVVEYKRQGDIHPLTVTTSNTSVQLNNLSTCIPYTVKVQSMCGLTGSYFSNTENFTLQTQGSCKSQGESTASGWIESVQVNNSIITTGDNNGFHFEPCTYVNVSPGGLCYLALKQGVPQFLPATTVYWRVWVDVSSDNEFGSDELIYDSGPVSGDIYVNVQVPPFPFVISNYVPKIRIVMKENSAPDACEIYANGETEDYPVHFVEPDYCFSRGLDDSQHWITRVQCSTIDYSSGPSGGYENVDSAGATITEGETHTLSITSGHSAINRRMYYRAWIDYNSDKSFTSDEIVLERYISQVLTTATQSFTVPHNAGGDVTMRVALKQYGYPEPCEIFDIGEVEDYHIKIENNPQRIATPGKQDDVITVYPSPANEYLTVRINSAKQQNAFLQLTDLSGNIIYKEYITIVEGVQTHRLSMLKYASGIYFVCLKMDDNLYTVKKFVVMK